LKILEYSEIFNQIWAVGPNLANQIIFGKPLLIMSLVGTVIAYMSKKLSRVIKPEVI
jgi:hypothetical protein